MFRIFWRSIFLKDRIESELDEEMQFHIDMQTEAHEKAGLSPEEARRKALMEFGGTDLYKEQCRDSFGTRIINNFRQDLGYAWRRMRDHKAFFAVVLTTIALCIGLNTLMFGIYDSLCLHPGLYPNEERIVRIADQFTRDHESDPNCFTSPLYYLERKEQSQLLENIGYYFGRFATITDPGESPNPQYNLFYRITPSLLKTLSVKPRIGRIFNDSDAIEGNHHVALLDYEYWQSRYQGSEDVSGHTFELDGEPYTIIGVLPEGFKLPSPFNSPDLERRRAHPIYIPWVEDSWIRSSRGRQFNFVGGSLALMKPGVSLDELREELKAIADHNSPLYPEAKAYEEENEHTILVHSLRDDLIRDSRSQLALLQTALILLMAVAATNIAGLFLSQNRKRTHELALRFSLGASRKRLLAQLLVENGLCTCLGAMMGLIVAYIAFNLLRKTNLFELFLIEPVLRPNTSLLLFVVALTMLTGLFSACFSILPLLWGLRKEIDLRSGSTRSSTEGRGYKSYQGLLIGAQVALSCFTIICASLLMKSFIQILRTDPGFDSDKVLTLSFRLPDSQYDEAAKERFQSEIVEDIRSISGVTNAGIQYYPPIKWGGNSFINLITERDESRGQPNAQSAIVDSVDTDALDTLGIPLLRGNGFSKADLEHSTNVVLIDEQLAHIHFPDTNPVGQRIALAFETFDNTAIPPEAWFTIIGVVGKVTRTDLLNPAATGTVYHHLHQLQPAWSSLVIKTSGDPRTIIPQLRQHFKDRAPGIALARLETMDDILANNYRNNRYLLAILSCLSAMVLLLSAIGLWGVISYLVSTHRKEIGIRRALGVRDKRLVLEITRFWILVSAIGIVLGITLAAALVPHFSSLLYRVTPHDPLAYGTSALFLCLLTTLTSILAAFKSTKVNILQALHCD